MEKNVSIKTTDIAILGAGIAGLGAALKARELGRKAVLYEARSSAGGLLDNFTIEGYRFDRAVHLSFATEPKVREIFDATPSITHPSDSYCFEENRWLKHPVQNNLFPLPPADRQALIQSYIDRPSEIGTTYEDWLRHQYGDAIAERFPIKYTQKYWATPAASLSTTWIGNRMRRSEVGEVLFGAFTSETPNTYYTKEMRYPEKGGYKAYIEPLIASSTIETNHAAVRIDLPAKQVTFGDGSVVAYNELVSTLPLPRLIALIDSAPPHVVAAASELKATSIDLISVGIRKDVVKDLWFYIYDDDILASRAYSPSIKSPENVPAGTSSLQFEVYSRGEKSRFTADELKKNTLYALEKMGICSADDIVFMDHRFLEFGNVIFDTGMEEKRAEVLEWLKQVGISSCGRFGEWDYLWSNQSLLSGYNAVKG